jgi:hypothetical protein
VTARTPYQETLLGDSPGSAMAWTLWQQGYERGVSSGYADGYAEGVADMIGAADQFRQWLSGARVLSVPTKAERQRRREIAAETHDHRSGDQLVADAHASWDLPTEGAKAA